MVKYTCRLIGCLAYVFLFLNPYTTAIAVLLLVLLNKPIAFAVNAHAWV